MKLFVTHKQSIVRDQGDKCDMEVDDTNTIVLDFVVAILYLFTLMHCMIRSKLEGICIVLSSTMIGLLFEYVGTQIWESHCHATSEVMLLPCMSLSSILFYPPWLYTCYFVGWKVPMSSRVARYLLLAFLHPLYSVAYMITGSTCGWFQWSDSRYLSNRFVGVPIMTLMSHFFIGIAFSFSRVTAREVVENYKAGLSLGSRIHQLPTVVQLAGEVLASSLSTAVLTPIVALLCLVLWGVPTSLESRLEVLGEGGEVLIKALSLATILASVAPAVTDRQLGLLNESTLTALRANSRGVWQITSLLFENEESQRDVLLLSIPYGLFLFVFMINVKGMYVAFTQAENWTVVTKEVITWSLIAVLMLLLSAWLLFGYFNVCGVLEPHAGKVPGISFAIPTSPPRSTRVLHTPPRSNKSNSNIERNGSSGSRSKRRGGKEKKSARGSPEEEILAHLSPGRPALRMARS